jgi:tripartite-type tricarboxylate transporter receptor subunit TctC
MKNALKLSALAALAAACPHLASAIAQDTSSFYPARPVRIVIPLGPGNSVEIVTRLVADKLTHALGQPFIIEPQPGASGQIGTERVARAAADGYTLLAANDGIMTMLPNLQKNVRYAPMRDFAPITQMVGIPFALIVHPSVPARTTRELIQLAKAQPGKLEFSSGGNGSAQHLAMELFMAQTGTRLVHVPYKGAPQAAIDVVAGQVPVAFAGVPIVAALIKQRRLNALAVAGEKRLALMADTPTLAEQGIAMSFEAWAGLFAPAATSPEIVQKLNQEAVRALRAPDVQARIADYGFQNYGSTSQRFAATIKSDFERMAQVIHTAGVRLD